VQYKIIKLQNGDDIISGVLSVKENKDTIALDDPYCLKQIPQEGDDGDLNGATVAFVRWIPFTEDTHIYLPLDRIITMTNVKDDLLKYYIKLSQKHKDEPHSEFLEEDGSEEDEDFFKKLGNDQTIH
tara:strand:+ start:3220 stop:3600 length:381 start_codon:yes stop_codon:yes gene_type:complete